MSGMDMGLDLRVIFNDESQDCMMVGALGFIVNKLNELLLQ